MEIKLHFFLFFSFDFEGLFSGGEKNEEVEAKL